MHEQFAKTLNLNLKSKKIISYIQCLTICTKVLEEKKHDFLESAFPILFVHNNEKCVKLAMKSEKTNFSLGQ